jgi:biotin operon repressor
LKQRGPISKRQLAAELNLTEAATAFHLGRLRKEGRAVSESGLWRMAKTAPKAKPEQPAPEPEVDASVLLWLYSAREGLDQAIAKLEELEKAIYGRVVL